MKLRTLAMGLASVVLGGAVMMRATAGGAAAAGPATPAAQHTFAIGPTDFLLDGQRFQIRCGEVHAARVPAEYWRHRLKMAHAMGLNTVCAYLFWNMHEPKQGQFNWSGQADVAQFCRIAQEEGLWVILRPGPYACAEWEMGGFPWWLLKNEDIKLRTRDPRYMDAVKAYLKEVGRVLGPLQITHGGPILMVQVENEYGFYGTDAQYMGDLRQALLDAGFDVTLFACNPVEHLRDGRRDDLFPVVNFGTNPASAFRALRAIHPTGPLMCGEFYPGWFDTWGVVHHTGDEARYLNDLTYMLENNESFSIYMAHGGTTFGLWSGADQPFKPDTSSYDYDAPITEAGWPTDKFTKTRELFSKHLLPGEKLPEVPATNPVMAFAAVQSAQVAPVFANLSGSGIADAKPRNMEAYDEGYGDIVYRTKLPAGPAATLDTGEIHDWGYVFIDGQRVGITDRRSRMFKIAIPARTKESTLDIFVETAGRVNFGQAVHDRKGIVGSVRLVPPTGPVSELTNWQAFPYPLDQGPPATLTYELTSTPNGMAFTGGAGRFRALNGPTLPAFYKFAVNLTTAADTWLDMRPWGKGVAWVNGHCLGRFWNIGPTQTMYVPGPWLKTGANEFVILDVLGPQQPVLAGLDKPILNELRPDLDFSRVRRPAVTLALEGVTPAQAGQFPAGTAAQEVKFAAPAKGRFFGIESLSAQDGKQFASIAELDLLDESGKPLSHEGWTVAYVDSEERAAEDGTAENAIDGQTANYWHTEWSATQPNHPHRLVLDLGQSRTITGFRYVPRQGAANVDGRIKEYRVYMGDGLVRK